jgi:hypothetical protein
MPTFRNVARHLVLGIGAVVAIVVINGLTSLAKSSILVRTAVELGGYEQAYEMRMKMETAKWWDAGDFRTLAFLWVFPMVAAWALAARNAEDKFVRLAIGAATCGVLGGAIYNPDVFSVRTGPALYALAALLSIRSSPAARWVLIPIAACILLLAAGNKFQIDVTKDVPVIVVFAVFVQSIVTSWFVIICAILVNRWSPFGSEKSRTGPSQAVDVSA